MMIASWRSIRWPCSKSWDTRFWRLAPESRLSSDQAMPNLTGSELAAAIRAEKPGFPIVLATGYAELPAEADRGLPKLAKPFRQQELAEAIAEAAEPERGQLLKFPA
jgi:FixJ family two-component response regulator